MLAGISNKSQLLKRSQALCTSFVNFLGPSSLSHLLLTDPDGFELGGMFPRFRHQLALVQEDFQFPPQTFRFFASAIGGEDWNEMGETPLNPRTGRLRYTGCPVPLNRTSFSSLSLRLCVTAALG